MTNFQHDWIEQINAKPIKDSFPNVSYISIKLQTRWCSVKTEEWRMMPDSPLHLSKRCENHRECGRIFNLTGILAEALSSGKGKTGRLLCDGKESRKPGAYGCDCVLEYSIKPIMK